MSGYAFVILVYRSRHRCTKCFYTKGIRKHRWHVSMIIKMYENIRTESLCGAVEMNIIIGLSLKLYYTNLNNMPTHIISCLISFDWTLLSYEEREASENSK